MTRTWTAAVPDQAVAAIATTERLLIALDFDGTASELVPSPMDARMHQDVRRAVQRLEILPHTTIALVSGRSMPDLRVIAEHTDDSPIALVGSHGAQYWYPGTGSADGASDDSDSVDLEALWTQARTTLRPFADVELEPKSFGFAVHTRKADPRVEPAAFAAIDALMSLRAPLWRRRLGHRVLEFSSRLEGKDTAIAALREKFHATAVLFAGDDVTDEDAIAALLPGDLGVRVGAGESSAQLRVEDPQHFAQLLSVIADERGRGRE